MKTVLVSVTDKMGLIEFANGLKSYYPDITFIASGGTAKTLEMGGHDPISISDYTGFPECFEGRVKTLHPKIAGGLLFKRGDHDSEAEKLGVSPIDMVICNLYDFESALSEDLAFDELVEHMDIGGSTLIRSAIKNYFHVAVVVDPIDYDDILDELESSRDISLQTRKKLAVKAINYSADYESLLAEEFTERLANEKTSRPVLVQGQQLRYGENPDQKAWVYQFEDQAGIAQADVLSGKELSYNNYEDATVAYNAVQQLTGISDNAGVAVVKHGSLCGYAVAKNLYKAFHHAWEGDPKSAFGSIVAFNSTVTEELVPLLQKKFIEVILAPDFSETLISWVKETYPNLRLLKIPNGFNGKLIYKNISGGMLVQTNREAFNEMDESDLQSNGVVTKHRPSPKQKKLFQFAISAVNFAKSNTIAIAREVGEEEFQLLGIGAGQPNRVDCLERLAIPRAIENLQRENEGNTEYDPLADLSKCVMASDGFFPFDDSIRSAAKFGLKYCIQPGGSKRDQQVIKTADELGMCMIFTGKRYFSH
jgi:phosphoribosylaminoimidazolecarboxamide formyltransferase / IMP cyclohydrolase